MEKKRYEVELLILLITYSMIAAKPATSTHIGNFYSNDPNNTPQKKYAQLFNRGANSYVRIVNGTIDATTTNDTDPNTYLQIDMYGPTLMAIRSYQTREYICHNPQNGDVEIKIITVVNNHHACLFHKETNQNLYSLYRSHYNKFWYLGFYGSGNKAGRPRKAQKSTKTQRGSMYVQNEIKHLRKG